MIEKIYIPTVRRADNQISFLNLPDELKKKVIMVIDPNEKHLYNYDCEYLCIPEKLVGTWTQLSETRLFIHKHAGNIKYAVIDDDVIIKKRNQKYFTDGVSDMEMSKRNATPEEIIRMYNLIDEWLDEETIGIAGLSDPGIPPGDKRYLDTVNLFTYVFYDGRKISKIIDDMNITSTRIAEDIIFMFEAFSRGINSRKSIEFMYDNRSMVDKDLHDTRIVWTEMFKDKEEPKNFYQSEEHHNVILELQKRYPYAIDIFEKDGKIKYRYRVKEVYKRSQISNSVEEFM